MLALSTMRVLCESIRRERENARTREREHDAEYLVLGNSVGTERRQQRKNSLG